MELQNRAIFIYKSVCKKLQNTFAMYRQTRSLDRQFKPHASSPIKMRWLGHGTKKNSILSTLFHIFGSQ